MSIFIEIFDELAKINDRSIVWSNWLNYCISINLLNLSEEIDFKGNEKQYCEMFEAWLIDLNKKLEGNLGYYDLLGDLYEDCVKSHSKAKDLGQYYTPTQVTDLMSELCDNNSGWINDCCCGSGRMLLSGHVKSKGNVYCLGQDLDEISCKMSVLNFFSHGVRGSILHMDTLTGEFYKGWRVNKYLYHGIPLPHIEKITNINDAFDFIDSDVSLISNDNKKSLTVNDNVSKQTTLI